MHPCFVCSFLEIFKLLIHDSLLIHHFCKVLLGSSPRLGFSGILSRALRWRRFISQDKFRRLLALSLSIGAWLPRKAADTWKPTLWQLACLIPASRHSEIPGRPRSIRILEGDWLIICQDVVGVVLRSSASLTQQFLSINVSFVNFACDWSTSCAVYQILCLRHLRMLAVMAGYSHRSFHFAQAMAQDVACCAGRLLMSGCCSILWLLLALRLGLAMWHISFININDFICLHLLGVSLLLSLIAAKRRRLGMCCARPSVSLRCICWLWCRCRCYLSRPWNRLLPLLSERGRRIVLTGLRVARSRPNHLLVRHRVVQILKVLISDITMIVDIIQRDGILVLYMTWWSLTNTQIAFISLSASRFEMDVECMRNLTYAHGLHWFVENIVGAAFLFDSGSAIIETTRRRPWTFLGGSISFIKDTSVTYLVVWPIRLNWYLFQTETSLLRVSDLRSTDVIFRLEFFEARIILMHYKLLLLFWVESIVFKIRPWVSFVPNLNLCPGLLGPPGPLLRLLSLFKLIHTGAVFLTYFMLLFFLNDAWLLSFKLFL